MLIKCPECGKEVSDSAVTCVHCGYPLTQKKEDMPKAAQTKRKARLVVASNIILGVLGFLILWGVLASKGGIDGNRNAAIISWFLVMGVLCALYAIKKLNKIIALVSGTSFVFSMVICTQSLSKAPAYLFLELAIAINVFLAIRYFKKNKVY